MSDEQPEKHEERQKFAHFPYLNPQPSEKKHCCCFVGILDSVTLIFFRKNANTNTDVLYCVKY